MESSTTLASNSKSRPVRMGSFAVLLLALHQVSCGTESANDDGGGDRWQMSGAESPSLNRTQNSRLASMLQPEDLAREAVVSVELLDNRFVDLEILRASARETGVLVYSARQAETGRPAYVAVEPRTGAMRVDVDDRDALYVTRAIGGVYRTEEHLRRDLLPPDDGTASISRTVPSVGVLGQALDYTDPNYVFQRTTSYPSENGDIVDVLAIYTAGVYSIENSGTLEATEANISLTLATNLAAMEEAFRNSGLSNTAMNETWIRGSTYTETGNNGECQSMLQMMANNNLPGVDLDQARNDSNADIVVLLANQCRDSSGGNRTGLAINVAGAFTDFTNDDLAYAVINYNSMLGAGLDATAHEIGHLLGAAHNIEQGQAAGYFTDSFGWCSISSGSPGIEDFRTIMSYNCGASSALPTIPYYSASNITVDRIDGSSNIVTMPVGSDGQENARAMAQTRPLAANWRTRPIVENANPGLLMVALGL